MTEAHTDKFVEANERPHASRSAWISVLSKAKSKDVLELWQAASTLDLVHEVQVLRPPETGMVMVQGRAGGAGSPFNLGEMTVTRCAVRLETGETGIGYVAGRDKQHAKVAAIIDAMMQSPLLIEFARDRIILPLERAAASRQALTRKKAKATQVDFFTMVRDRKA